ncbi:hypothetical protein [Corynebacterium flavescens]|uniref:Uncharacterized protein n=1 Tax=Corynebacterium flavescens TaxID=28028 RepID=A0AB73BAU1_CORFL|nr:hypothetical protein [Corynebacterium flavescens]GEB98667.1 hypothetical protein CFL01nite_21620 [Corynebacterium flavescens]
MFLPIPIVITGITETGSSVIDFLSGISIALYDLVSGAGSSLEGLSSVPFDSLISSF